MISLVVPVYNVESFLRQCLDSLVNQTYSDIEIICVNDGSTDGSLEILKQYAKKDSRIIVVNRENRGVSESRNEGIHYAKGDWLMFVDSDDWIDTDCCKKVISKSSVADLVMFSYVREFRSSSAPKHLFDQQPKQFEGNDADMLLERFIALKGDELRNPTKLDSLSTVWGKLYKTSIIKQYGIKLESTRKTGTLEDLLFNVEYLIHANKVFYLPDCLYHQRKANAESITYSYKPNLDSKWLYVFQEIESKVNKSVYPWLPAAIERRKALCLFGLGLNISFCQTSWHKKKQMLKSIITSDWYHEAVAHLNISPMPLHWRCFYIMARKKQAWAVILMLKAMNMIIRR